MLVWVVADELHILSLATEPQFRARIARTLLADTALEYAKSRKVRLLLLEVRRSNASALAFYRTFGFSAVGVRPRYYADIPKMPSKRSSNSTPRRAIIPWKRRSSSVATSE